MKKLIIMICLTTTTGMANQKSINAVAVKQVAIVKQDFHLEYECCKITYDEIREQLRDGEITIEQAQQLWLEHKKDEQ